MENGFIPVNKAFNLLLLLIATVMLASLILFIKQGTATPQIRQIEVIAKKFFYTPGKITLNRGDKVTIRLISEDVHHGLYIDGYDLNTTAYPGSNGSITFRADKTGTYQFRCSVTCGEHHPYMVGSLRVLPNTRFFVLLWIVLGAIAIPLWKLRK